MTVSNRLSLTALKSKEFTLISGSFQWGRGDHHQFSLYLPISWLFQNELSLTAFKSEEFTLSSGSFKLGGIIVSFTQVNLTIWAHFALASQADLPGRAENLRNVNCSCRGSVVLGEYIIRFIWCHTDIAWYLPISWLFPNGHSLTALKSEEFTLSSGSFTGGSICLWHLHVFSMPWYFLISSCYLAVSNDICLWYLHVCSIHWYFLISSYYLTVLHGHSLTVLKRIEFTQCSGIFELGGPSAFGIYMFSLCTGISWYLPIIWLFQMATHWWHWAAQSWLSALAVSYGGGGDYREGGIIVSLSALVFPDIFLLVDHFKWVLIGNIWQCRVDSVLWQFWMGGGG